MIQFETQRLHQLVYEGPALSVDMWGGRPAHLHTKYMHAIRERLELPTSVGMFALGVLIDYDRSQGRTDNSWVPRMLAHGEFSLWTSLRQAEVGSPETIVQSDDVFTTWQAMPNAAGISLTMQNAQGTIGVWCGEKTAEMDIEYGIAAYEPTGFRIGTRNNLGPTIRQGVLYDKDVRDPSHSEGAATAAAVLDTMDGTLSSLNALLHRPQVQPVLGALIIRSPHMPPYL